MKTKKLLLLIIPFLKAAEAQVVPELTTFKVFNSGQSFSCITADTLTNTVWSGTSKAGLYVLNNIQNQNLGQFSTSGAGSTITSSVIQSLASDKLGNLWVGHAGNGGSTAAGGGLEQINISSQSLIKHYSPNRDFKGISFFERDGIATLNVKNITVDYKNTVWLAHRYHDLTSSSDYFVTPGALSFKNSSQSKFTTIGGYKDRAFYPEWPYPAYTSNPPITASPQSRTCNSISSDSNEVWISVYPYTTENLDYISAQIRKFDLSGKYLGNINFQTIGITSGGVFNGIFLSPKGDKWVTISAGKGFAVCRNNHWTYLNTDNLSCIVPSGTTINENSIWGNKYGNVFIGTNNGLIVYNGRGPVNVSSSYTLYNKSTNSEMSSNNIKSGYSERDSIQWMATDNGILRAIIGRYDTDSTKQDYKICKNSVINSIEDGLNNPNIKNDKSYHIYKVETEVCTQDGTNGKYCTAENIFKMLKDNIKFCAITPYDFPFDVIAPNVMASLNQNDLTQIQTNINNLKLDENITNPNEPIIKSIKEVLPSEELKKSQEKWGWPFLPDNMLFRDLLTATQNWANGGSPNHTQCGWYRLYNASNFWTAREAFAPLSVTYCDSKEIVNPAYDPIFTVRNESDYTITNYTDNGHMLYPGKITRQVVEECGKVKIVTIGEGTQFCGSNTLGKINGISNSVVGCILFKNVDFRLIREFNKFK